MARPVTADVFAGPALPLLLRLEAEGFDVVAEGDRLRVRPPARLTPELVTALREHKADLLMLLRCCDAGVQARRDVFEYQYERTPAPGVPMFLFRPSLPYAPGVCFSCGDGLQPPFRFGRCWRCSLAWRLAYRLPITPELATSIDEARRVS